MGRVLFPIVRARFVLYSAGSGLNRVVVVLSGFSVSWFVAVQSLFLLGSFAPVVARCLPCCVRIELLCPLRTSLYERFLVDSVGLRCKY